MTFSSRSFAEPLPLDMLLGHLKAAGEVTRLRLLALLARGELTVKDMTAILGQSQPRISRHLKLLSDDGLVERHPEGSWVYYRLADGSAAGDLVRLLLACLDEADAQLKADSARRESVMSANAAQAAQYFTANAESWDSLRALHVPEAALEAAMLAMLGPRRIEAALDLGTGTGQVLALLAPLYARALGIDTSHDMLCVARANLDRAGIAHAQVRQGDLFTLALPGESFDLVTLHQVLHYFDDPARAIREAARHLTPDGRMLIVDFAPHDLEFLREHHAHRRLGFSHEQMQLWLEQAGFVLEKTRDLASGTDSSSAPPGKALTVSLWLARKPAVYSDFPLNTASHEIA